MRMEKLFGLLELKLSFGWGSKNRLVKDLPYRKFIIFIKCNQALLKNFTVMFVRIFVYLGSEFIWMRLNFDWNSALDSPNRGRNLLREHWQHWLVFQNSSKFLEGLIMYSCSKYLPQPSRWIAGLTIWKL